MKQELKSLLLFFFIILTAVSLYSYHADDPCIGNGVLSLPENTHNMFGLVGAHLAGLFIFVFGMGAYWLPVIMGLLCLWYFKSKPGKIMGLTLLGGLILMVGTGGFFFLFKNAYALNGTLVPAGGLVGEALVGFLLRYVNIVGTITVLCFFLLVGFVLSTGISLVNLLLWIRKNLVQLGETISQDFNGFIDHVNKAMAARRKKRAAKPVKPKNVKPRKKKNKTEEKGLRLPWKRSDEAASPEKDAPVKKARIRAGDEDEKVSKAASAKVVPVVEPSAVFEPDDSIALDDVLEPQVQIRSVETDDREYVKDKPVLKDIREAEVFHLPTISFLREKEKVERNIDADLLQSKARILENKLKDFNVKGDVVEILPGPVITTFEYRPAAGVKLSKIVNLADDLALALSAISIRIVAPIPGRDVVGIEIPNEEREMVLLRELVASKEFVQCDSLLTLGLGKDLMGRAVATKMDKMPHLLIAGATGTGKSVGLNSMIISLLYKATPDEVKFIMIDPKRIELSVYNDIPHLISPVVTDMKKATNALYWAVREMERRYELLEQSGLRNLGQYNQRIREEKKNPPEDGAEVREELPYIVVIVDELSDLMMVASKDVEFALTRLAQMARAAGIHLILATQRPSADVLTGTIKANFPTRISFQVSSKIDGRIIIDQGGAENLLGNGDMLFCPPGTSKLVRIQGAYISEDEIGKITAFLKEQRKPEYNEEITMGDEEDGAKDIDDSEYDEKYDEAVAVVTQSGQASISYVQRRLRIGYNRAARLIEIMEHEGIIGPQIGAKGREVLVKNYEEDGF
ncbi:MAG: DNA translocase FtsK 4TM domain-containing protein [Desulfobacterales bacterium]|nr:DNA translocase FtsK 4TM domain-containing protein [Desulfobacterales bacterium]